MASDKETKKKERGPSPLSLSSSRTTGGVSDPSPVTTTRERERGRGEGSGRPATGNGDGDAQQWRPGIVGQHRMTQRERERARLSEIERGCQRCLRLKVRVDGGFIPTATTEGRNHHKQQRLGLIRPRIEASQYPNRARKRSTSPLAWN